MDSQSTKQTIAKDMELEESQARTIMEKFKGGKGSSIIIVHVIHAWNFTTNYNLKTQMKFVDYRINCGRENFLQSPSKDNLVISMMNFYFIK